MTSATPTEAPDAYTARERFTGSATYSPEDNKLRLYPFARLSPETYARVKAAGFSWAPKQGLFVAPMWTPEREDLLEELAGDIGDEDTSLTDRAEERAERFEDYREKRAADADQAHAAVARIADGIPFGQPILVGHHSEKHARKDAERIERGMEKAVKMWKTSKYWAGRAAGAIRHAKYKERPDVRARRIKGLEADQRKQEKYRKEAAMFLRIWRDLPGGLKKKDPAAPPPTLAEAVGYLLNRIEHGSYTLAADFKAGTVSAEDAQRRMIEGHERTVTRCTRWLEHYTNRLEYERAMLAADGGTATDKTGPEKGGACKCWASPRGGWSYIQKVNKVSVSVLDNWGNGGPCFSRTIPFDKLAAVMTAAQVQDARDTGQLIETSRKDENGQVEGFILRDRAPEPTKVNPEPEPPTEDAVCPDGPTCPDPECQTEREKRGQADIFEAMAESLRAGVQVVSAPNLFPTPVDLARRMVELANLSDGDRILEPSAGTGHIVDAILEADKLGHILAVERVGPLAHQLGTRYGRRKTPPAVEVVCADFLNINENIGKFDRIVMNPPFDHGSDIKHIRHALTFLKPGGRLVALCANGPNQVKHLQPAATSWEDLPAGTFAGTGVRAALITFEADHA